MDDDRYRRARSRANRGRPRGRVYAAVLAPDPLICGLCNGRIDKSLPRDHLWAKTVDHIIPIIEGGAELDPDNLQPSHRTCNQQKEIARRSGINTAAARPYAPVLMKPLVVRVPRQPSGEIIGETP